MTEHQIVIRFGRPFDLQLRTSVLAGVREITVPFADRESAESAQREITVSVRPVHDAGGEDYRPVVPGEVIREPADVPRGMPIAPRMVLDEHGRAHVVREPAEIEAGDLARAYLNPDGGLAHRHLHGAGEAGWVEHDHLGGGLPHFHDPETGFRVPLAGGGR